MLKHDDADISYPSSPTPHMMLLLACLRFTPEELLLLHLPNEDKEEEEEEEDRKQGGVRDAGALSGGAENK